MNYQYLVIRRRNPRLPLSLLVAGILFVDHEQLALTPDDLTIGAAFLYGCFNFHVLFVSEYNSTFCQIIRRHLQSNSVARQDADVIHAHFPGDVS